MNEQLRAILCVSHTVWYPDPTGVHVFNWVLRCISWFWKSLDLFLIQNKLIYCPPLPSFALYLSTKTNTIPSCWLKGWSSEPPQFGSSRVGCFGSAKWMQWSGSVRPTSVILSHLPAKREGEMHSRGLKEGWAGLWERNPVSAGWSAWMRVTTTAVMFAKSLLKLTMQPVEGQPRQEIEVNNIVTY